MLMIDLHSLSVKEAKLKITETFQLAIEQGQHELYIITGRGNHTNPDGTSGVLKKLLPALLKPYSKQIDCIDREQGAYKIVMHTTPGEIDQLRRALAKTDIFAERQRCIEQDASAGDAEAKLVLASLYLSPYYNGPDKTQDALRLLTELKDAGLVKAALMIAELHLNGWHVKRDPQKAFKLYSAHASADQDAKFMAAKCYLHGEGIKRNDDIGSKLMLALAEDNHASACGAVGESYLSGDFTPRDFKKAVYYLQRAAVQNFYPAYVPLARCYAAGQGVEQSTKHALIFYKKAAAFNNPFALFQLGYYSSEGRGCPQDEKAAHQYFLRGAQLGDNDCQGQVAMSYLFGTGVARDVASGLQWLSKAAAQNHVIACYIYGCILLNGQLTAQDTKQGLKYINTAIKGGDAFAMFAKALFMLTQPHDDTQKKEAFCLLEKAVNIPLDIETDEAQHALGAYYCMTALIFFRSAREIAAETKEKALLPIGLLTLAVYFSQQTDKGKNALGLVLAEHAAKLGYIDAQWFLVRKHFDEKTPTDVRNLERGLYWLQQLATQGEPEAVTMLHLSSLYDHAMPRSVPSVMLEKKLR